VNTIKYVPVNSKGTKADQEKFINVPSVDVITEQKVDKEGKPVFLNNDTSRPVMVTRKIRYCEGEGSIYVDEQMEDAKPGNILMQGPILIVSEENRPNLAEYLTKTNYNESNPDRRDDINAIIKEYDVAKLYQKSLDQKDRKVEAIVRAQSMDFEELKAFLIVSSNRPNMAKRYNRMTAQEIRHEAYNLAEHKPEIFLRGIEDDNSKIKIAIIRSISAGIIKHDEKSNELLWGSGVPIMRSPRGINVVDEFCQKVTYDPEYQDHLNTIVAKLGGQDNRLESVKEVAPVSHGDRYDATIDEAVKEGIVEKAGKFFTYDGVEYEGYQAFKKAIKEDGRRIYNELLDQLED